MHAQAKWIKLAADMFDNPKIKLILNEENGDTLLTIWVQLLCFAGKTNLSGQCVLSDDIACTPEMIATIIGRDKDTVRNAFEIFERLKMIETVEDENGEKVICIRNWSRYQSFDSADDRREKNRLAKQRQRKRQKEAAKDGQMELRLNPDDGTVSAYDEDTEEGVPLIQNEAAEGAAGSPRGKHSVFCDMSSDMSSDSHRTEDDMSYDMSSEDTEKEEKEIKKPEVTYVTSVKEKRKSVTPDYDVILERWNDVAKKTGLDAISRITPKRQGLINARIQEHARSGTNGFEHFISMIDQIPRCGFCLGRNDHGWRMSFDWFIRPENFTKFSEGKYLDRDIIPAPGAQGTSGWMPSEQRVYQRKTQTFDDMLREWSAM